MILVAVIIAAAIAGTVEMRVFASGMPQWLVFGLLVAIITGVFWGMMPWWRSLDDMQKDAQYQCWYWGGTYGAVVAALGLIVFAGPESQAAWGAIILLFGQTGAFIVAWIWWRFRNGGGGL